MFIISNTAIRNIQNLLNIWEFLPCRFITFLSFALNYHFDQLNVFGYHIFNTAVHLSSAIFVWWLTLLTLSTPVMKKDKIAQHANLISLLAGLVFVSHPVQIEAVTYIWQRAASMATLFYLASLSFYVKSRLLQDDKSSSGPGRLYYIFSLIAAVGAMFTKEIAITLPLMILLYEIMFLKDKRSLNWGYLSPFLLTIFIIPLITLLTHSEKFSYIQGSVDVPGGISPMQYVLTQFRVMVTYIRLVFLPLNQNLDYDYPIFKSIFELPVLISFLFLIIIILSAKRLLSKYRLVSFSIFWFFLTLLPEAIPLTTKDVIFEHRLYLPLVGYSIFLVSSMYYLFGKNTLKTMVIALTIIIAGYSILTYQRNKVWKDDLTLWDDTIQKSPHRARAYRQRGDIYDRQGRFTQALSDYSKAIELKPDYGASYNNRGIIYAKEGSFTQAMSDFSKAIKLEPDEPVAYYNRGNIYVKQGNFTQALSDFTKVIKLSPAYTALVLDPNYADVYNNRGFLYYIQGRFTQALSDYSKAIEIVPNNANEYSYRAVVYYQLKEYGKAWDNVHKAEELGAAVNPNFVKLLKTASSKNQ